ncbi:MAG: TniB family NTP-binding protein, partial [Bradyrhizobium sp.]|nr:TniB family NTP-binding protein [Bradyrhizobium sp.]
ATNNGKTMIARRFHERHKPHVHVDYHNSAVPVLMLQAPPVPDEGRFYNAILSELYVPFRHSSRIEQRQLQVQTMLSSIGVRVLIIDEVQHILAGTSAKQRHFLNVLKYLSNELMISIVAVGTRDAFNAIHADPQLANRFEPALLPVWKMNEEYLRLLASIEALIPLNNPTALTDMPLASKILALSEGTIGEICDLLRVASLHAIRSGIEQINDQTLMQCGYQPPSTRRRPPADV